MPKDKRSFFERLTGSISLTEDDHREYVEEEEDEYAAPAPVRNEWVEEEEEKGELSVDVYSTSDEIVVQAMVAGVKPDDLNVSITRELVTIEGKRDRPAGTADENYYQRELYWGPFSRTIMLPHEIETEEAEAIEKNGLLTIRLPRIDKERIQKVKVKSI